MKFKLLKYFIFLVISNYILPCCCDGLCNSDVKTNSSGNSSSFTTPNLEQNNEVKLENQVQTFIEKYKIEKNRQNEDFNEYRDLYNEMTNDIFTKEVTLELISYIDRLKEKGFIDALNYIFQQNIIFYMYLRFSNNCCEEMQLCRFYSEIVEEDNNITCKISINKDRLSENCKKIKCGEIYVNGEKFKYFRCKGCADNNCISCKLRTFLEEQNLKDKFKEIFKDQGNDSNYGNPLDIKRFIYQSLQDKYKNIDFYNKIDNLDKNLDKDFRKCIFIEWALTIVFLEKFIKYIYGENGELNLYRSVFNRGGHLLQNITKTDLFESTSIFGPVFLNNEGNNRVFLNNYEFFEVKDVKFYRCLFNYIISFNKDIIFGVWGQGDAEQEIGFIPINYKYKKLSGSNLVLGTTSIDEETGKEKNKIGDHFINHYKFIDKTCKDILKICLQKKYPSKNIIIEILDNDYIFKM